MAVAPYSHEIPEIVYTCPHCGAQKRNTRFIATIVRPLFNHHPDLKINSGYRCDTYNDSLKNAVPNSAHTKGLAVDIAVKNDKERYEIIKRCFELGIKRIFLGAFYVHIDIDGTKPSPRFGI